MIAVAMLITILYFGLISYYLYGFLQVKKVINKKYAPLTSFSIIIPFRNEAENLPTILQSLKSINYPFSLFEIIFVNDDSTDNFKSILNHFAEENSILQIKIIDNKRFSTSPKKDAINNAITVSSHQWIVTTDADCIVPENWLQLFNQFIIDEQPYFISAPVNFIAKTSFLFHFQNLHFLSLIGSSIGSFGVQQPLMCNGANLCYNKYIFQKINGFEGNLKTVSGDDVFLMEKINAVYPLKTKFLKSKDSMVQTNAEISYNKFINQQLRWASKTSSYQSIFSKGVGLLVFTINFSLILLLLLSFSNHYYLIAALFIYFSKLLIDFLIIRQTAQFLNNKKSLRYFLIISLVYPFFIVYIGLFSQFKNYEWKGRKFK
ncbi:glycosyltransferase [Lutibacter sp.]|uniref:glycosyltransferase family 2 protein n=1 Tax=Lutibacter sp. TaxID=1925666 RepID=UPI002734D572|nr:glycosyltransferase [Lutibacter sp.]MDP3313265.1 glycosyltransferase [Lutibacter sp.]